MNCCRPARENVARTVLAEITVSPLAGSSWPLASTATRSLASPAAIGRLNVKSIWFDGPGTSAADCSTGRAVRPDVPGTAHRLGRVGHLVSDFRAPQSKSPELSPSIAVTAALENESAQS